MPDNQSASVRWGKKNEWKEIIALSNSSFGMIKGGFEREWPHSYTGPEAAERCVVATVCGTIVGAINTVPLRLRIASAELSAVILCGVCVARQYRGRGIMSAMISFAHDELRRKGFCLSFLWGSRRRYSRFGYEIAGQSHYVTIRRNAFRGITPAKIRRLRPSNAATVLKLHRSEYSSVLRTLTWQQRLLLSSRTETWGCTDFSAYATVARRSVFSGDVLETGGDQESVARLILLSALQYLLSILRGILHSDFLYREWRCIVSAMRLLSRNVCKSCRNLDTR